MIPDVGNPSERLPHILPRGVQLVQMIDQRRKIAVVDSRKLGNG